MAWLKQRREELQLSQEELTKLLNDKHHLLSRSAVSAWENSRSGPSLDDKDYRNYLARALQLDVTELLRRAGYEVLPSKHTNEGERAAFIVDQLPPSKRELALKLLEALID